LRKLQEERRHEPKYRQQKSRFDSGIKFGADDEARTRYLHLGKVALYQMSYIRISAALENACILYSRVNLFVKSNF
jgi:hypothetical protein